MKFIGDEEKWIPGYGIFKPGDSVEYNENLFSTGYFEKIESAGE